MVFLSLAELVLAWEALRLAVSFYWQALFFSLLSGYKLCALLFGIEYLGRFPILVGDFAAESPHIFMGCLCGDVGIPPL